MPTGHDAEFQTIQLIPGAAAGAVESHLTEPIRNDDNPIELTGNAWFDSLPEVPPDDPIYSMPPTIVFGGRMTYSDDAAREAATNPPAEEAPGVEG